MYFLLITLAIVVLDQGTKMLVQATMNEGQSIPVIDGIFKLTYVQNAGAAFGIFQHRTAFFIVITFLVIFLVLFFYKKMPKEKLLFRLALGLQLGGAIGNLIDRIRIGRVTDFFEIPYWPVFNVADMAIVIGVGLLVIELMRTPQKKEA